VTAADPGVAAKLRRLRNYGQADRYHHVESGVNSRLDPLQAALLSARLPGLAARTRRRRAIAEVYEGALAGSPSLRPIAQDARWLCNRHLFPVFTRHPGQVEVFRESMKSRGVETLVHYPIAMPDQEATPPECRGGDFPAARRLASTEVSLPIYPELSDAQVETVRDALVRASAALD
jgi:dTDP-4-amino-4,6-dideoxygalactose transaminase